MTDAAPGAAHIAGRPGRGECFGMAIHVSPLATVDPRAELDDDVTVGPYCVVGPHVRIGRGTRLENQVTLLGHVALGRDNHLWPGVVIGGEPQDLSYRGAPTRVVIGDGNCFREGVTVNRATEKEDGLTVVGHGNYLMACSHVAHDCKLGNQIVIANGTLLGGHVHIHDHASLSGGVGVHHYTTIGAYSFVSGLSRVLQDVPPYMLADGNPARARCINVVALKRNDFSAAAVDSISEAHRLLYRAKVGLGHAREILANHGHLTPEVEHLLEFVAHQQGGRHGRARERMRRAA